MPMQSSRMPHYIKACFDADRRPNCSPRSRPSPPSSSPSSPDRDFISDEVHLTPAGPLSASKCIPLPDLPPPVSGTRSPPRIVRSPSLKDLGWPSRSWRQLQSCSLGPGCIVNIPLAGESVPAAESPPSRGIIPSPCPPPLIRLASPAIPPVTHPARPGEPPGLSSAGASPATPAPGAPAEPTGAAAEKEASPRATVAMMAE
ncbi:hypothetical protein BDV34DRAFT_224398 [Aspergillus parasiticus]|uniref:Uncharacterized protein n=1 Tax=Aspergillus parasiticus TaxID=5067 RepID=A0A5N6DNG8_ASPPA|nr:hypothetical protein BDV34DRAFT_224398 [Aspergillus parasiticus]